MDRDRSLRVYTPRRILFALGVLVAVVGSPAVADEEVAALDAAPQGLFSEYLSVRVLDVDVVVTDSQGRPVSGLGRDQFTLKVDGKPVPITYFYAESRPTKTPSAVVESTPQPRADSPAPATPTATEETRANHVVILVDHTRLRASYRRRTFSALESAIDSLAEDTEIAIVGIEGGLVFYTEFSTDRLAIRRTLEDIAQISIRTDLQEIERRQIFGELARGISGGIQARASLADPSIVSRIRSYAAEEYERGVGTLRSIERVVTTLAGLPGSKTLIYVGEGVPNRPGEGLYVEYRNRFAGPERGLPHQDFNTDYTREIGRFDLTQPMRQLATTASRAGVTLYAVDAAGGHGMEVRSALTEQGATSETVTIVDENYREPLEGPAKETGGRLVVASDRLDEQLKEMFQGLRTFYSIGFAVDEAWSAGAAYDIEVAVAGEGLRVRHAQTLRVPARDEREAAATTAALLYGAQDNPLGVRATPGSAVPRDEGVIALPVQIEIPIDRLSLLPGGESLIGSLAIYVAVKDSVGDPGRVQKVPFELVIPTREIDRAIQDYAHYTLPVVVRKGDRSLAIGVRDNVGGMFSAIELDLSAYSRF